MKARLMVRVRMRITLHKLCVYLDKVHVYSINLFSIYIDGCKLVVWSASKKIGYMFVRVCVGSFSFRLVVLTLTKNLTLLLNYNDRSMQTKNCYIQPQPYFLLILPNQVSRHSLERN